MTETPNSGSPIPHVDWHISRERAYYKSGNTFIKRSHLPHEREVQATGQPWTPAHDTERLLNEALSLMGIRKYINIPVPEVHVAFEPNGCFFLITEWVDGEPMYKLSEPQKKIVKHDLRSTIIPVDPRTLTVKAIIDWEYAEYYAEQFEMPFYNQIGPSVAINEERDDVPVLDALCRFNS